jgi:hypothetical protein
MGHSLLGRLQKTREWKDVIALITNGAGVPEVAEKLIVATGKTCQQKNVSEYQL